MKKIDHIIGKQLVDVAFEGARNNVFAFHNEISELLKGDAKKQLSAIMDEVVEPGERVHIDRLTLDLGSIPKDKLLEMFPRKLSEAFRKAIIQTKIDLQSHGKISEVEVIPEAMHPWRVFIYFLHSGQLPWWTNIEKRRELETLLLQNLQEFELIRPILIDFLKGKEIAKNRLIFQFTDTFLNALFQSLVKDKVDFKFQDLKKEFEGLYTFYITQQVSARTLINVLHRIVLNVECQKFSNKISWVEGFTKEFCQNANFANTPNKQKPLSILLQLFEVINDNRGKFTIFESILQSVVTNGLMLKGFNLNSLDSSSHQKLKKAIAIFKAKAPGVEDGREESPIRLHPENVPLSSDSDAKGKEEKETESKSHGLTGKETDSKTDPSKDIGIENSRKKELSEADVKPLTIWDQHTNDHKESLHDQLDSESKLVQKPINNQSKGEFLDDGQLSGNQDSESENDAEALQRNDGRTPDVKDAKSEGEVLEPKEGALLDPITSKSEGVRNQISDEKGEPEHQLLMDLSNLKETFAQLENQVSKAIEEINQEINRGEQLNRPTTDTDHEEESANLASESQAKTESRNDSNTNLKEQKPKELSTTDKVDHAFDKLEFEENDQLASEKSNERFWLKMETNQEEVTEEVSVDEQLLPEKIQDSFSSTVSETSPENPLNENKENDEIEVLSPESYLNKAQKDDQDESVDEELGSLSEQKQDLTTGEKNFQPSLGENFQGSFDEQRVENQLGMESVQNQESSALDGEAQAEATGEVRDSDREKNKPIAVQEEQLHTKQQHIPSQLSSEGIDAPNAASGKGDNLVPSNYKEETDTRTNKIDEDNKNLANPNLPEGQAKSEPEVIPNKNLAELLAAEKSKENDKPKLEIETTSGSSDQDAGLENSKSIENDVFNPVSKETELESIGSSELSKPGPSQLPEQESSQQKAPNLQEVNSKEAENADEKPVTSENLNDSLESESQLEAENYATSDDLSQEPTLNQKEEEENTTSGSTEPINQVDESGKNAQNEEVDPESKKATGKARKRNGANIRQKLADFRKKLSKMFSKGSSYSIPEEGLFIDNAGAILLHPFLSTLFETVGYTKDKAFINQEAQVKAIHLFAYAISGELDLPEFNLTLNKFLCGYPLEESFDSFVELEQEAKNEVDQMLGAVIKHWAPLKDTTPDGLRVNFLQRKGKLVLKESGYELMVKKEPYDILLNKLPWGIGIVKLPWMDQVLHVDWN